MCLVDVLVCSVLLVECLVVYLLLLDELLDVCVFGLMFDVVGMLVECW